MTVSGHDQIKMDFIGKNKNAVRRTDLPRSGGALPPSRRGPRIVRTAQNIKLNVLSARLFLEIVEIDLIPPVRFDKLAFHNLTPIEFDGAAKWIINGRRNHHAVARLCKYADHMPKRGNHACVFNNHSPLGEKPWRRSIQRMTAS